jgi:hypothetical protein
MQQTQTQRREIADLLRRGCIEARESASLSDSRTALPQVRASCAACVTDSCSHSKDVYLHKTLRFLAYAEACTDSSFALQERNAYVEVIQSAAAARGDKFLGQLAGALSACNPVTVENFLASFLLSERDGTTTAVSLSDFVTTETEMLLHDKAARNIAPNVMLLQALRGDSVNQRVLRTRTSEAVARIARMTSTAPLDVVRSMFSEANLEIWAVVACRTQEDACLEAAALWRSVVSDLTEDCNSVRGTFSMLMFFLYLEGMLSVLTSFVSGQSISAAPPSLPSVSVAAAAAAVAADIVPNDDPVTVSASVPVPLETVSVFPIAQPQPQQQQSMEGVITVRKVQPSAVQIIEEGAEPSISTAKDNSSSSSSCSKSADTLASLAKFVELNQSSFPEGLPKSLQS